LWKSPQGLTDPQVAKLEWIAKTDPRLHRAYLLKEGPRTVFTLAGTRPEAVLAALGRWISWARRCRIEVFVELRRRILKQRDVIHAALTTGMSNGLIESTNTKTRLIIRRGSGFKYASAVIALVMLTLGGHRPELPGRQPA
jgi:transposase